MKKFLLKFWLVTIALIVGVFIGMQKANEGMLQMKGYEDDYFQSPVHISENTDGKIEAALLGNEMNFDRIDLAEKKQELEELETFNFFSALGKALSNIVTTTINQLIQFIISFFE